MECDFSVDVDGEDMADECKIVSGVTTKPHTCYECLRVINVGEVMTKTILLYHEESPGIYKACPDCASVAKELFNGSYYLRNMWDDVGYAIEDYEGDIPERIINSLTPAAKWRVIDMIDKSIEVPGYWYDHGYA